MEFFLLILSPPTYSLSLPLGENRDIRVHNTLNLFSLLVATNLRTNIKIYICIFSLFSIHIVIYQAQWPRFWIGRLIIITFRPSTGNCVWWAMSRQPKRFWKAFWCRGRFVDSILKRVSSSVVSDFGRMCVCLCVFVYACTTIKWCPSAYSFQSLTKEVG